MFLPFAARVRGAGRERSGAPRSPAFLLLLTGWLLVLAAVPSAVASPPQFAAPDAAVAHLATLRQASLADAALAFAAGEPALGVDLVRDLVAAERASGLTAEDLSRRELALLATVAVHLANDDRHGGARAAAREAIRRAKSASGGSREQRAAVAATAGELAEWIEGDVVAAQQWYRAALGEWPEHPVAVAALARLEARIQAEREKAAENELLRQREREQPLVVGPVPPRVVSIVPPERTYAGPDAMVPPVIDGRK